MESSSDKLSRDEIRQAVGTEYEKFPTTVSFTVWLHIRRLLKLHPQATLEEASDVARTVAASKSDRQNRKAHR